MTPAVQDAVRRHYTGEPGLVERIQAALAANGIGPEGLGREDVARLEEFHIGGRQATRELADRAGFRGDVVLDLGAGLGGPARTLATEYDCRVVGLDLTPEYCRAAAWLTERLGLDGRVEVRVGDAVAPPFPDASFDGVVLEHVTMNIEDKPRLFAECHRLLRPGGRLALYEICRGAGGDIAFPVPWAADAGTSHLVPPHRMRALAEAAGFEVLEWDDVTPVAADRLRGMLEEAAPDSAAPAGGDAAPAIPPIGLNLVMGEATPIRGGNLLRAFDDGAVSVVRGVLER